MSGARRAVVCLPTYNEKENLEAIVTAILGAAPEVDVLVIDDSSPVPSGERSSMTRMSTEGADSRMAAQMGSRFSRSL